MHKYCKLFGYEKVRKVFWLQPTKSLDKGLRVLKTNKDLLAMIRASKRNNGVAHIFYEHIISDSDDEMIEVSDSDEEKSDDDVAIVEEERKKEEAEKQRKKEEAEEIRKKEVADVELKKRIEVATTSQDCSQPEPAIEVAAPSVMRAKLPIRPRSAAPKPPNQSNAPTSMVFVPTPGFKGPKDSSPSPSALGFGAKE